MPESPPQEFAEEPMVAWRAQDPLERWHQASIAENPMAVHRFRLEQLHRSDNGLE